MSKKTISAEELDRKFDDGEDISDLIDMPSAIKRVSIDFPLEMLKEIDAEASRLGVARQAIVKIWIDDRLEIIRQRNKERFGS